MLRTRNGVLLVGADGLNLGCVEAILRAFDKVFDGFAVDFFNFHLARSR
jgi:hypothetical protein